MGREVAPLLWPEERRNLVTRLGFIGVGKHAQKLAAVFRELGCDIVTHVRASSDPAPSFGERDRLDLAERLVVCCPPRQALAYAQTVRVPMLVSKPLLATEPTGLEHVSVDLWRLWSPAWRALKQAVAGRQIDSLRVVFTGNGPFRETHNGALDYGPHAMAFVHDLLGELDPKYRVDWTGELGAKILHPSGGNIWRWSGTLGGAKAQALFGNGSQSAEMAVDVESGGAWYRWAEHGDEHALSVTPRSIDAASKCSAGMYHWPRAEALHDFCSAWLRNETAITLQLSCLGMRALSNLDRCA